MSNSFYYKLLITSIIFSFTFTNLLATQLNLTQEEKDYIENKKVVTYSEVNWKPLSIIENNKMNGIMGDFLKIIQEKTNLQFDFVPSKSWPDVLKQFEDKKIDIVPGIGTSDQELKLGLASKTYAQYPMVIVTGKKYSYLNGIEDLKDKVIAVPKYYTSYNFLLQNSPDIKLITTSSIPDALLLVESGKADAFVGHIATSLYYISELHLKNLKISGNTNFIFEHKYLIQNHDPLLLSIINKAFDSISSIERKQINEKWVQTTVIEKKVDFELIGEILVFVILIFIFIVYRQISLKKLNKALSQTKEEIEVIFNSTLEAIIISQNGTITNVNDEAVKLFKFKNKNEIIGLPLDNFVDMDVLKSENKAYETNAIKSNDSIFIALVQTATIIDNNCNKNITSIIDISDLKQKEQMLIEQSKMASMGEMIGNIAHQWRQPLSGISMTLSSLKLEKQLGILSDEEFETKINNSIKYTEQLSKTIETFRDFIKLDKKNEHVLIEKIINKSLDIVSPTLREKSIRIKHNINKINNIYIDIIADELIQVLMNIYNNSKDILSTKDNIVDKWIDIQVNEDEDNVIICIEDNGGGIPENVLPKIFDPYFTTKHKSQGTGLGLHMSYRIITESINGEIIASNTDNGALFTIKIPKIGLV